MFRLVSSILICFELNTIKQWVGGTKQMDLILMRLCGGKQIYTTVKKIKVNYKTEHLELISLKVAMHYVSF